MSRSWWSRLRHLVRRLRRREAVEQDLADEVRSFFEIRVEQGRARGLSEAEARRAAAPPLEGPAQVVQRVREARVGAALDTTWQDLRYAWRGLKGSPGFTLFAVATIALCLGANAAIFTLVDGLLLKPSGYPEPERIVQLWETRPGGGRNPIAPANYLDWAAQSRSFEAMAAHATASMALAGDQVLSLRVARVSAPYFEVFGVRSALGRTFARDEDRPGRDQVAVLSHRLWRTLFGSDRSLIGRSIQLDQRRFTVAGVLPRAGAFDRRGTDLYIPLAFSGTPSRDYHHLTAVARLRAGVTLAQAQAELGAIAAGLAERHPTTEGAWGAGVQRYLDRAGSGPRTGLLVLMAVVVVVLLIGCANLTHLLLARATARSREIAVRLALGASRARIARLLLTESLLISGAGAVLALALGHALLAWIHSLLPPFFFPPEADVALDGRVVLFLAGATILTSLGLGLAPAIQASHRGSFEALKEGAVPAGKRARLSARQLFIAGQVATAFFLLAGAGLLIRSLQRVAEVDTGFAGEGVVAAGLPPPRQDLGLPELTGRVQRVLDEARAEPGIREVALASALPLRGWGQHMPVRTPASGSQVLGTTGFKIVTPRYFQTLGLRRTAGRLLDAGDRPGSPLVIVVNQSFARRYFPGQDALGERVVIERVSPAQDGLGAEVAWEIVGVVADEKGSGLERPTDIGAYVAFAQNPVVALHLLARGSGEAGASIQALQRAVTRVDARQALDRPRSLEDIKAQALLLRRLPTLLLGGFALLALLLACAGIAGVLAFVTARRTQELAIRAALGASRLRLIGLCAGSTAAPVLAGVVLGLTGALASARLLESLLFATRATDLPNLLGVTALVTGVALAACLVPAWRAARVAPMTGLRQA